MNSEKPINDREINVCGCIDVSCLRKPTFPIETKWKITHIGISIEDIVIEFCPNGVLKYKDLGDKSKWKFKKEKVIISLDSRDIILIGKFKEGIFSGKASNIKGDKWTFRGKQIQNSNTCNKRPKQDLDWLDNTPLWERRSYNRYGGAFGLDDNFIDDALDGDPTNYWNID